MSNNMDAEGKDEAHALPSWLNQTDITRGKAETWVRLLSSPEHFLTPTPHQTGEELELDAIRCSSLTYLTNPNPTN